jgi:hypothetical protein
MYSVLFLLPRTAQRTLLLYIGDAWFVDITLDGDFLGIFHKQVFINVGSLLGGCGATGVFTFAKALL